MLELLLLKYICMYDYQLMFIKICFPFLLNKKIKSHFLTDFNATETTLFNSFTLGVIISQSIVREYCVPRGWNLKLGQVNVTLSLKWQGQFSLWEFCSFKRSLKIQLVWIYVQNWGEKINSDLFWKYYTKSTYRFVKANLEMFTYSLLSKIHLVKQILNRSEHWCLLTP